jgi:hypothetical protein
MVLDLMPELAEVNGMIEGIKTIVAPHGETGMIETTGTIVLAPWQIVMQAGIVTATLVLLVESVRVMEDVDGPGPVQPLPTGTGAAQMTSVGGWINYYCTITLSASFASPPGPEGTSGCHHN